MSLKRLATPSFWRIARKTKKFVVKPLPGPHSKNSCLPIGMVLRDMLHHAYNMKEVKFIMNQGLVRIDGKIKKEKGFPVGLMDVIAIGDEIYRIVPGTHIMKLMKIDKKESNIKLLRIKNKVYIKKGKIQLNFHDGKNIVVDKSDYKTNDVIVYDLENKSIKDVLRFEKGSKAIIIKGNNVGSIIVIKDIIITKNSMPNQAVVVLDDREFIIPVSYLFVVGKDEPIIKIGE